MVWKAGMGKYGSGGMEGWRRMGGKVPDEIWGKVMRGDIG